MNKFSLIAVAVLCFALVQSTWGLSCPCWEAKPNCRQLDDTACPYGLTTDACGCCPKCINGPGEECGGPWRVHGPCPDGYECVTNPEGQKTGIREICKKVEAGKP